MTGQWQEVPQGGSFEAEQLDFARLAEQVMGAQLKARKAAKVAHVDRAFHAKPLLTAHDADLTFLADLPAELTAGFAQPGARYPAIIRISNAANRHEPDFKPDLRGFAMRIDAGDRRHDMLATNFPVSHARDARQFVKFAVATAGGTISRVFGLLGLVFTLGPGETVRMVRNISAGRRNQPSSVALETYWSRGAIRWGDQAVRYLVRPVDDAVHAPPPSKTDPDYLSREAARRLARGPIHFELCIQRFVDEQATPIEDTAIEWKTSAAPVVPVGVITIPQHDANSIQRNAKAREIETLAFNPWNSSDDFRPLGNLNRARKSAYDASAAHRNEMRWLVQVPLRNRILSGAITRLFALINRRIEWHRLPLHASLLNLDLFRPMLRTRNLIDSCPPEPQVSTRDVPAPPSEEARRRRSFDGRDNDLSAPEMGAVGQLFGRNLRADHRPDLFETPNPVVVSEALLKRETFIPARSLNILAAAWIQFQVHDWVDHERHRLGSGHDLRVPLPPDYPDWQNTPGGPLEREMRIAGNIAAHETPEGLQLAFANQASHWWDGSEIYGADEKIAQSLREGSRLRLSAEGYLPEDVNGMNVTGFNQSWWMGLATLHTLFAREHNLLCDELHRHYPLWSDDRVYHTARLIVSALIAKIHTIEWTPAILATKQIDIALNNNWAGPGANDWLSRLGLWLLDAHSLTGIPATKPDHHRAPYCLTEDFATVYRLHPLLPDDYGFFDHLTGKWRNNAGFLDIQGARTDEHLRDTGLANSLYSFGIAHPGAITLHNYPNSLRHFERDGERIDLSVVDIVRTRRRGVPRYNDFRAGLHKSRIRRWEDLSSDPESVRLLREIYRSVDEVDTMVGLFAEPVPQGFGFSDTAFRIFILMASRRLQSDRFLTVDYRPEIYSPFGIDWIEKNGFTSVILRHCPELAPMIPRDASAFAPWRPVMAA